MASVNEYFAISYINKNLASSKGPHPLWRSHAAGTGK
jgi:hypothetical protein